MTLASYDPDMSMLEARAKYFAVNQFGEDGGYEDDWVDFKLGPIPMPFPNTPARRRAVRYHDLHHIVTNYDTDTLGEFEISAWEVGAGCKDFIAAWQLNLAGTAAGVLSAPRRTWRAFLRGRRSETLYGKPFEELLGRSVRELRAELRLDEDQRPATFGDRALFALTVAAGLISGLLFLPLALLAAPLAIGAGIFRSLRGRRARPLGDKQAA